jgi:hypothetical protein
VPILLAGKSLLKHMKVLTILSFLIEEFSFHIIDNNAMDALRYFTLIKTSISNISVPVSAFPRLKIVDLSYNFQMHQVQVFPSTIVKLNLEVCLSLVYSSLSKIVHLKFLSINGFGHVWTPNVESLRSLEEIMLVRCWNLRMIQAWSQLERLNFLSSSQIFSSSEVSA